LRLRIVLQPTEYSLAIEPHHGITLDRVKQIAAGAGHLQAGLGIQMTYLAASRDSAL
jgi:hypothetical protein